MVKFSILIIFFKKKITTTLEKLNFLSFPQKNLFSSYLSLLKTRPFKGQIIVKDIVYDLVEHLSLRPLDPANLLIGSNPSDRIMKDFRPMSSQSLSSLSSSSSSSSSSSHLKKILKERERIDQQKAQIFSFSSPLSGFDRKREKKEEKSLSLENGEGGGEEEKRGMDFEETELSSSSSSSSSSLSSFSSDKEKELYRFVLRWRGMMLEGDGGRVHDELERLVDLFGSCSPWKPRGIVLVLVSALPLQKRFLLLLLLLLLL